MADRSKCCDCCCCSSLRGVQVGTGIFLVLSLLESYNFAPLEGAAFRSTFVTDQVVADATTFCTDATKYWRAGTVPDCALICHCDGKRCDMDEDIGTLRAAQFFTFALHCADIYMLGVGFLGATMWEPKALQFFMFAAPTVQVLKIIPTIMFIIASIKAVLAWYLHNANEFGDYRARCTQEWLDSADKERFTNLVAVYFIEAIVVVVYCYLGYEAKRAKDDLTRRAKDDLTNAPSAALGVSAGELSL